MVWKVARAWASGEKVCIVDVPLLIEAGMWKWVGKVVVVYTQVSSSFVSCLDLTPCMNMDASLL